MADRPIALASVLTHQHAFRLPSSGSWSSGPRPDQSPCAGDVSRRGHRLPCGPLQDSGQPTGFSVIADNGGIFPHGTFPLVIVISGVVFAYAAVELVGTAAGETANPAKIMPRAINSVIARIAVFLRRLAVPAGASAAVHVLQGRRESVRHLLLQDRRRRRGHHHEHRRADRRVLQPQRRAVLDRPDPAVDGDERQRAEVHVADDQARRAVRRYLPDRGRSGCSASCSTSSCPARRSRSCSMSRRSASSRRGAPS